MAGDNYISTAVAAIRCGQVHPHILLFVRQRVIDTIAIEQYHHVRRCIRADGTRWKPKLLPYVNPTQIQQRVTDELIKKMTLGTQPPNLERTHRGTLQ